MIKYSHHSGLNGPLYKFLISSGELQCVAARRESQQMHASGHVLRGFTASPDAAVCFLDRPMGINCGEAAKARFNFELAVKPEGSRN